MLFMSIKCQSYKNVCKYYSITVYAMSYKVYSLCSFCKNICHLTVQHQRMDSTNIMQGQFLLCVYSVYVSGLTTSGVYCVHVVTTYSVLTVRGIKRSGCKCLSGQGWDQSQWSGWYAEEIVRVKNKQVTNWRWGVTNDMPILGSELYPCSWHSCTTCHYMVLSVISWIWQAQSTHY